MDLLQRVQACTHLQFPLDCLLQLPLLHHKAVRAMQMVELLAVKPGAVLSNGGVKSIVQVECTCASLEKVGGFCNLKKKKLFDIHIYRLIG